MFDCDAPEVKTYSDDFVCFLFGTDGKKRIEKYENKFDNDWQKMITYSNSYSDAIS